MSRRQAPFTVQDIVRATQGALVGGDLAVPVTGISIDSRSIGVGEAFFAIKGHRLDGHEYLGEAAGRGSACLVVHELPADDTPPNVPLVLVQDTTTALGRLAGWHRAKFSIPVVAAVHTEFLGSIEGVRDEKAGLVRALRADGLAVLNADDARVASMARDTRARVVTFGTTADADVRAADDVVEGADGLVFTLEHAGRREKLKLALSGRHNVVNALAAAGAGVALGLSLDEVAAGLAVARPAKGRCVWRTVGEVRILDDTYNANPDSVRAALDTVQAHRAGARVVAVLGDMLELGASADAAHREIGRYAVTSGVDVLVGLGRHVRALLETARAEGIAETQATETFEDTVAFLLKKLVPGDLVLIKGSRGMRMERIVDALVARLARAGQE